MKTENSRFSSISSDFTDSIVSMPLMTPAAFSHAIGLEETVFRAQFDRGYWGAPIRIGKRVFVNVEAVRIKCAERALEFVL